MNSALPGNLSFLSVLHIYHFLFASFDVVGIGKWEDQFCTCHSTLRSHYMLKYHILRFLFEFQLFNINEDGCYDNIGI